MRLSVVRVCVCIALAILLCDSTHDGDQEVSTRLTTPSTPSPRRLAHRVTTLSKMCPSATRVLWTRGFTMRPKHSSVSRSLTRVVASPVADHQVVSADADLEEQGTQEVLVVEGMVEATITPPLVVVLRGPSLTSCLIKVASLHSRSPPLRVCHEFRCVCCKRRGKLYLDEFRKL